MAPTVAELATLLAAVPDGQRILSVTAQPPYRVRVETVNESGEIGWLFLFDRCDAGYALARRVPAK